MMDPTIGRENSFKRLVLSGCHWLAFDCATPRTAAQMFLELQDLEVSHLLQAKNGGMFVVRSPLSRSGELLMSFFNKYYGVCFYRH